jgi:hypothetical protein
LIPTANNGPTRKPDQRKPAGHFNRQKNPGLEDLSGFQNLTGLNSEEA